MYPFITEAASIVPGAMVRDKIRAGFVAVLLGLMVVFSGFGAGVAVTEQEPSDRVQPTQATGITPVQEENNTPPSPGSGVVEAFRERMNSLDTLVMSYNTNVTINDNRTVSLQRRMWVDYKKNRVRIHTKTEEMEIITVRNESTTVTYNVDNNQVSRFETPGGTEPTTPIDRLLNNSEITYEGTEHLNDRQTYRLSVTPEYTGDMLGSVNVDIWIDNETYFPTKINVNSEYDEFSYETTTHFRNVSLNQSIPDSTFKLNIPEDAKDSVEISTSRQAYESLSKLRSETDRFVPSPDVPERYSFNQGSVVDGEDYQSVTLRYRTDSDKTLNVVKRPSSVYNFTPNDRHEEVDINGNTGYYTQHDGGDTTLSILVLPCENNSYSLSGNPPKNQITYIAESLKCN